MTNKTNTFKLSEIYSAQNLTQYGNFKELFKKINVSNFFSSFSLSHIHTHKRKKNLFKRTKFFMTDWIVFHYQINMNLLIYLHLLIFIRLKQFCLLIVPIMSIDI